MLACLLFATGILALYCHGDTVRFHQPGPVFLLGPKQKGFVKVTQRELHGKQDKKGEAVSQGTWVWVNTFCVILGPASALIYKMKILRCEDVVGIKQHMTPFIIISTQR